LNSARTVSEIVNADVSATAAIAGTKVAPNFGSQNVVTTGSIGAGTSSPSQVFHGFASGAGAGVVGRFERSNGADVHYLDIAVNPDANAVKLSSTGSSNGSIVLGTAAVDAVTILNSGNVGIGTSSPIANVHVRSASGTTLRLDQTSGEATIESTNTGVGLRDLVLKGDKLIFNANAAERMRIDASGDIFIGASTATAQGKTQITFDGATKQGVNIVDSSSAASSTAISFIKSSDTRGSITVTASATAYNTSSDYRLKQNVEPLAGGLAKLKSLAPKTFEFKVAPDVKVDGFIAHEVQAVVPQAVTGEKDGEQMQGLDMSKLVPVLVAAVQELTAKVEALEAA
jgi:hypothetical protein